MGMAVTSTVSGSTKNYPGDQQYPRTTHPEPATGPVRIRKASLGDVSGALADGARDWLACRTDVLVMVVIYPLAGVLLAGVILDERLLPFVFPVCAGVALIGPVATIWFAALSRQRELDGIATADAAAAIFDSQRLPVIRGLAALLILLFLLWVAAAGIIYGLTLGSAPDTGQGFFHNVFTTTAGHEMIIVGVLVCACFALLARAVGLVGFQLALDRRMSLAGVIGTSIRTAIANPGVTLAWGAAVIVLLVLGALPGLLGLAITVPILGHGSWHLYRRLIEKS
jgi:uncharacterized membrane protein